MLGQANNGFNPWTDVKTSDQSPKIIVELSSEVPSGRIRGPVEVHAFWCSVYTKPL